MIFAFEGGRREDSTKKWKRRRWHRGVSETFFKIHHGFIFEKQINQFDQNKSSALSIVLNFGKFLFDLYNNAPFSYFDVWLRLCIVSQYLPADFEDLSHLCRVEENDLSKTSKSRCQHYRFISRRTFQVQGRLWMRGTLLFLIIFLRNFLVAKAPNICW